MLTADKQALKDSFRRLVRAVGGQEAAVGFTRLARHQALSDYGNPAGEHAARFAPVDVVADLEAISHGTAGHPVVTRQLARQAGYALVRLPNVRAADDLPTQLYEVIRETSEVTLLVGGHLQDTAQTGCIGRNRASIRKEISEAVQALLELDALIEGEE